MIHADAVQQNYLSCTFSTSHIRTSQGGHKAFLVCIVSVNHLALSFFL